MKDKEQWKLPNFCVLESLVDFETFWSKSVTFISLPLSHWNGKYCKQSLHNVARFLIPHSLNVILFSDNLCLQKFLFWECHRLCRVQGTVPEVLVSRSEFTETDIPVGVGGISKTSGGKQMQYHCNVLVMGLEGSANQPGYSKSIIIWN